MAIVSIWAGSEASSLVIEMSSRTEKTDVSIAGLAVIRATYALISTGYVRICDIDIS